MQSELLILVNVFCNIGLLEICASLNTFWWNSKKFTNTKKSLQFPVEINIRGSKTCNPFQSVICRSRVSTEA